MGEPGDDRWMARALELACEGLYSTPPNPVVGCVLVRDGALVGEGSHLRAGEPHAEVHALAAAGAHARGATAYVSLEPCDHHGRTPPCVDALLAAGVARVVAAMRDPNPRVAGRGLERLRRAGVLVDCGLREVEARALNRGFVARMTRGRPWVTLKLGASLDGRTALANGASRWITGEAARSDVQRLRARASAILTGVGTVLADDPRLTVRDPGLELRGRVPLRAVLDRRLRTPVSAALLREPGTTLLLAAASAAQARAAALRAAGAELATVAGASQAGELRAALELLAQRDCNEVLVEAGPTLAGALLEAGLVDELVLYLAPTVLGDAARPMFAMAALERMADRREYSWTGVERIGADLKLTARPRAGEAD
jgi:diaminohydroxyphosphoribosylaminopyrimidine deaminase/5-amino-6-(5-phosphoribosylamino)uracil reductase